MRTDKTTFSYAVSHFFKVYLPGERGFSENTITSYRDTFKQFLTYCKVSFGIAPEKLRLSDFSRDTVNGFLAKLEKDGKSASTRNQRLAALKSFFGYIKFAFPEHLDTACEILAIRMKKQSDQVINYISAEGVACLLRQPDSGIKTGYRDMLILTLMYDSGARVSEVTQIRVGDIRTQIPATITLHGKGFKDRIVPLSEKTNALIKVYVERESLAKPQDKDKCLFINHSGEPLTRAGVAYILNKYVAQARTKEPGMMPEKFSPHCMRHSKAMHLLQAGVAMIYIRDFLGHESIKTTEVYAKSDSKNKRAALEAAYIDIPSIDPNLTDSWDEDTSLMRFLEDLCSK
jgi:site-specific recombinase XerD